MALDDSTDKATDEGISVLERASQFSTALQLVSFLLAVDVMVLMYTGKSMRGFEWSSTNPLVHFGPIVIFIVCYSLFMSLLSPIAQYAIGWIWIQLRHTGVVRMVLPLTHANETTLSPGHVPLNVARSDAYKKLEVAMMDRVDQKESKAHKENAKRQRVEALSFACVLLAGLDQLIGGGGSIVGSISTLVNGIDGFWANRLAELLMIIIYGAIAAPWAISSWIGKTPEETIYHPALRSKLDSENRLPHRG